MEVLRSACLLVVALLAVLACAEPDAPVASGLADVPIIRPEQLPGADGANINGPSLIRAPEWLPGWPSADRRTRIVCIGHRLRATWIDELLDLLDEEVADEVARRSLSLPRGR